MHQYMSYLFFFFFFGCVSNIFYAVQDEWLKPENTDITKNRNPGPESELDAGCFLYEVLWIQQ